MEDRTPALNRSRRRQLLLLALSALLFALAFPPLPTGFLAYFFLVPFFALLESNRYRAGLRWGFALGFVACGLTLYWMSLNAGTSVAQGIGMHAASTFHLALGFGLFGLLQALACRRWGRAGLYTAPVLWTAVEFAYAHGELSFSWHSLATTQTDYLPLLQVASVTGMFGVSFAVVLVNVLFYLAWRTPSSVVRRRAVAAALGLIGLLSIGGLFAMRSGAPAAEQRLRVAVVQPNVSPTRKWTERLLAYREVMKLTAALDDPPYDLVVWPETATAIRLTDLPDRLDDVRELAAEKGAALMTGGLGRRRVDASDHRQDDGPGATRSERVKRSDTRTTNDIYLFRHDTDEIEAYQKIRLVPIGEYVPDVAWFLEDLLLDVGTGSMVPGDEVKVFDVPVRSAGAGGSVPVGGVICLEAVFGPFVREFVLRGARLLVVVTNDAWYDGTSQPYQHSQITVLRAIEQRIPVVRCANSGISSVFDRFGRAVAQTRSGEQTVIETAIPIDGERSFYTFAGDWFPLSVSAVAATLSLYLLGAWLLHWRRRRR
jgi:apolipoprotein N-acyltransferase